MPSDITGTEIIEEDLDHRPPRLPVRARADLRQRRARRRDQPHAAQDPGGAAPGDAGARGHRGRHDVSPARPRSSCWRRRTRSSRKAPIRCPRRSSTGSCSSSGWGIPAAPRRRRSSSRPPAPRAAAIQPVLDAPVAAGHAGARSADPGLPRAHQVGGDARENDPSRGPAVAGADKGICGLGSRPARVAVSGARRQGPGRDCGSADGRSRGCAERGAFGAAPSPRHQLRRGGRRPHQRRPGAGAGGGQGVAGGEVPQLTGASRLSNTDSEPS